MDTIRELRIGAVAMSKAIAPAVHAANKAMGQLDKVSDTDDLIGLPRAAKLLGVTRPTALLAAAEGRFPSRMIDGRRYARVSDVLAYREQRERAKQERRRFTSDRGEEIP